MAVMFSSCSYGVLRCGLEGDEGKQWDYHPDWASCQRHNHWEGYSREGVQECAALEVINLSGLFWLFYIPVFTCSSSFSVSTALSNRTVQFPIVIVSMTRCNGSMPQFFLLKLVFDEPTAYYYISPFPSYLLDFSLTSFLIFIDLKGHEAWDHQYARMLLVLCSEGSHRNEDRTLI